MNILVKQFDDLKELNDFTKEQMKKLAYGNQKVYDDTFSEEDYIKPNYESGWYGDNVKYNDLIKGVTVFQNMDMLTTLIDKFRGKVLKSEIINKISVRKLDYNSLGLGVFSFDRAIMSMQRTKKCILKKTNKIIDCKDIKNYKKSEVEIKEGVKTDNKNIYAYFPLKNKSINSVEFVISVGLPSRVSGNEMLYNSLPSIILGTILEEMGVKTKITIASATKNSSGANAKIHMYSFALKRFEDTFDINNIALVTSDPAYIRFSTFKQLIAIANSLKFKIKDSLGTPVTKPSELKQLLAQTEELKHLTEDSNKVFVKQCISEQEVMEETERILNLIANTNNNEN